LILKQGVRLRSKPQNRKSVNTRTKDVEERKGEKTEKEREKWKNREKKRVVRKEQ
jgi:hypothetical protein